MHYLYFSIEKNKSSFYCLTLNIFFISLLMSVLKNQFFSWLTNVETMLLCAYANNRSFCLL